MDMCLPKEFDKASNQIVSFLRLKDPNDNPRNLPAYVASVERGEKWTFGDKNFVSVRPCKRTVNAARQAVFVEGREVLLISPGNMARYELIPQG